MSQNDKLLHKFIFQLNEAENQSGQPLLDDSSTDELIDRLIERISIQLLNKDISFLDVEKRVHDENETTTYTITYELSETVDLKLLLGIRVVSPKYAYIRSELSHKNPSRFPGEHLNLYRSSNSKTIHLKSFKNLEEDLFKESMDLLGSNIDIYRRLNENRNLDKEFEATYKEALESMDITPKSIKKITNNPNLVAEYNISVLFYEEEVSLTFKITKTEISVNNRYNNEFIALEQLGLHNFDMKETLEYLAKKLDRWFVNNAAQNQENYNNYDD